MPLPKHPIPLVPLIGLAGGNRRANKQGSESDVEDEEDFKGDEEDDDEELLEEAEKEDDTSMAIDATRDAARYSELCEQYDKNRSALAPAHAPSLVFCSHSEEQAL